MNDRNERFSILRCHIIVDTLTSFSAVINLSYYLFILLYVLQGVILTDRRRRRRRLMV